MSTVHSRNPRQAGCRLAVLLLAASLGACDQYHGKEQVGTLTGAALGGLLGASIGGHGAGKAALVGSGVFLGGIIGNQIGRGLDQADRLAAERATRDTLERGRSGEPGRWRNPDSGHYGEVVARPAYRGRDGAYCREYTQTVTIGGRREEAYGTACRGPDGDWRLVG